MILLEKENVDIKAIDGAQDNLIGCNFQSGIVPGFLNSLLITQTASNAISFDTGLIFLNGFRCKNTELHTETISITPSTPLPMHIVLQIDIRSAEADSTVAFITRPIQNLVREEIFKNGFGKWELELCRFNATASGVANLLITADIVDKTQGWSGGEEYTVIEKQKLLGIEDGAQVNLIESFKVNGTAKPIVNKAVDIPVPTELSELNNDTGFIDSTALNNYVPTSRTINGQALNEDITISTGENNVVEDIDYITFSLPATGWTYYDPGSFPAPNDEPYAWYTITLSASFQSPSNIYKIYPSKLDEKHAIACEFFTDAEIVSAGVIKVFAKRAPTQAITIIVEVTKVSSISEKKAMFLSTNRLQVGVNEAIEDSTELITSGGVYTILGDIETLLGGI